MTAPTSTPTPDQRYPWWRSLRTRVRLWREAHPTREAAGALVAGFLWDVFTLDRIDSVFTIVQQGVWIVMLMALLVLSEKYGREPSRAPRGLGYVMEFSETIIHFLFGGLLSSFALFYFKSSAGLTSALFVGFVFVLLVGNEVPTFRKVGRVVRFGLLSFCVTSYFAYVFPVVFGFLSVFLFLLATVLGTATMYGLSRIVERVRGPGSGRNVRATLLPAVLVQAALLGMYVLHVVPPVPLSVTYMGVCHGVERVGGDFVLQRARSPWRLWEMVRPVFRGREGDSVHVFVAVFAPRGFQDQVNVRWAREDVGGNWRTTDVVRLAIHGGRLGGFRGHTNKARYEAGEWRVQVETADGRGIGVLRFTIVEDLDTADRDFKTERR